MKSAKWPLCQSLSAALHGKMERVQEGETEWKEGKGSINCLRNSTKSSPFSFTSPLTLILWLYLSSWRWKLVTFSYVTKHCLTQCTHIWDCVCICGCMCFVSVGRAWVLGFSYMAVSAGTAVLLFLDSNNVPLVVDRKDNWGVLIHSYQFMTICINYEGAGFFLYEKYQKHKNHYKTRVTYCMCRLFPFRSAYWTITTKHWDVFSSSFCMLCQ